MVHMVQRRGYSALFSMGPLKRSPAESWPPYLQALHDSLLPRDRANDCPRNAGNNFLPGFVERFNERFAGRAAKPENLHRQMNVAPSRLSDILCHREQRYVGAQLSFHYDRKQIILERSEVSENLGGQYVELYDFADRPLEVRWKGLLPTVSSVRISVSATPPSSSRLCISSREGAEGSQAHNQGDDEQRKDWLPETNAHSECAAARAQRCPESVTSV
jgi:hypothetical protein